VFPLLLLQVRELAQQINPGLEVVTCGSYRRGKLTCGDVDILVTHSDGRSHRGVLPKLIQEGRESGFLTDDLTIHNDQNGGGKYLGVCRLPGQDRKYRRIDIYVTPYAEFPCMLLHFTGSGHFNRSIRSKADKLGMSLSEHSLNIGVIRKNGVKVFEGTPVPVFSERDVFKYLDLPYREPTERDWD
jgi:DNA polymerase lambda